MLDRHGTTSVENGGYSAHFCESPIVPNTLTELPIKCVRMINVVSSSTAHIHLKRLHEWLIAEWGEVESFDNVPPPLLATEGRELFGGLMFSSFHKPGGEELGLWINALFVAPEHRRKGIASQLILAAQVEAARTGERELFALTDIPTLYVKLGWQCVNSSSNGTVVAALLEE